MECIDIFEVDLRLSDQGFSDVECAHGTLGGGEARVFQVGGSSEGPVPSLTKGSSFHTGADPRFVPHLGRGGGDANTHHGSSPFRSACHLRTHLLHVPRMRGEACNQDSYVLPCSPYVVRRGPGLSFAGPSENWARRPLHSFLTFFEEGAIFPARFGSMPQTALPGLPR